jgi:phosphoribosylformylglycinamidine synthase
MGTEPMSHRVPVVVVRTAGTNCDAELVRAFQLAGALVDLVHVDRFQAEPSLLRSYRIVAFPGGFAHGDDVSAGRVLAMQVRRRLYGELRNAVNERGVCVLGVCNGFQVLVQAGLLPGPTNADEPLSDEPAAPTVALAPNASDRFIDDWAPVRADPASPCVWTAPLIDRPGDEPTLALPVAHAEGRFVCPPALLEQLLARGRVALRYLDNPNGSAGDVAGLCDHTGRVFGLMPHPERFLTWRHHPEATRLDPSLRDRDTPGLAMFRAAVKSVASEAATHSTP